MTGETTEIKVPEVMHFDNLTGNGTTPTPAANLPAEQADKAPASQAAPSAPHADDAPKPRERTQREIAMEAIALNRRKAIEKELNYGEQMADDARRDAGMEPIQHRKRAEPGVVEDGPEIQQEAKSPVAETPQAAPQAPVQTPQVPQAQPLDRVITVGGQQYRVTQQQLEQLASVGAVAVDAMNRQQYQQQQPQPQQQAPQQQPQAPEKPQAILTPEESKAIATRIQYGNEVESARAVEDMTNLMAQRILAAQPQLNPQAVVQYATQQAIAQMEQKIALERNLNQIGSEFPEIFNNEKLAQLAALSLHSIRQKDALLGVQKPDLIAYREACEEVRTLLGTPPAVAPQPQSTQIQGSSPPVQAAQPVQGRFEAKRAAPRSIQPAQMVAAGQDQGRRYPTPAEIVASMRKSRGQAT